MFRNYTFFFQIGVGKSSVNWDVIDTFVRIFHTVCQQRALDVRGGHAAVDQAHVWVEPFRIRVLEKWSQVWPAGLSTLVKAESSHVETRYRSGPCLSSIVIHRSFRRSICERDCAPQSSDPKESFGVRWTSAICAQLQTAASKRSDAHYSSCSLVVSFKTMLLNNACVYCYKSIILSLKTKQTCFVYNISI